MDPMNFITVLQENMLAQDIIFSIQHPDDKIRDKAKEKAMESIDNLKSTGIELPLIFYMYYTSIMVPYVTGTLSLSNHRDLIQEYLDRIYNNTSHDRISLMRQMIVQMAVLKAKAGSQTNTVIDQVRQHLEAMNLQ